ncbi:MAG: histidine phosphatase family protein [Deltaproteobacteria bacterium]|nr:histidine phosphatase family protein [Deltaproteobacteria bacterium]
MSADLARPKLLVLLRHAKSSWKHSDLADLDRPLNKRGRVAAPRIGLWLKEKRIVPDRILSSPARRAIDTAELALSALGSHAAAELEPALYLAEPAQIWDVIRARGHEARCLMIVGHNEGMEELVSELASEPVRFPTGAVAVVSVHADDWARATRDRATVIEICRPKDLAAGP